MAPALMAFMKEAFSASMKSIASVRSSTEIRRDGHGLMATSLRRRGRSWCGVIDADRERHRFRPAVAKQLRRPPRLGILILPNPVEYMVLDITRQRVDSHKSIVVRRRAATQSVNHRRRKDAN